MQNIDPIYFLTPVVVIVFSAALVLYWHFKRSFTKQVLAYSLIAYVGAIILKIVVQELTIGQIRSSFSNSPVVLGTYFGAQTAVFEVGGAFLVAGMAFSRQSFAAEDAEGYGLGLAFWENGVYIGIFMLLTNYIVWYSILSTTSPLAQSLYSTLSKDSPSLFYAPSGALPLIGYAILERVSSLLAHFSWGFLAVMYAVYRKRIFFAIAFPTGFLVDFLTQFSNKLGIGFFELSAFGVGLISVILALKFVRRVRMHAAPSQLEKPS